MNRIVPYFATFLLLLLGSAPANAALSIFACEPEWAALASELAGARATVYAATTAQQNVHMVQARPSLIARARNADLLICSGADLEVGWLPPVIQQSGNERIVPGKRGNLEAANYVPLLDVPAVVDRALGDLHPRGNPHVHLDPHNLLKVAHELELRLAALDPAGATEYASRAKAFAARMETAIRHWEERAAPLRGVGVIEHHKEFTYLFHWLGMTVLGSLEPKPGVEPTSSHLEELLRQQKESPAKLILQANNRDPRPAQWLSEKTATPAVALPWTLGGDAAARDLFSLFDELIDLMLKARKS